jgi:hypothetical protein
MCMMVYLASDYELPEIANKDDAAISILRLDNRDQTYKDIQEVSIKPFVYYAGSHSGCGCGFSYGFDYASMQVGELWEGLDEKVKKQLMESNNNTEVEGKKSVEQLFDYIRKNLIYNQAIELFSYWTDKEGSEIEIDENIYFDIFKLGDSFDFKEFQCMHFFKDSLP